MVIALWRMIAVGGFVICLFIETGCQTTTIVPLSSAHTKMLAPESRIYIATPHDGSYGGRQYAGSGATVASAFDAAFSRHVENVIVGGVCESVEEAITSAKSAKCSYVVCPKISHWEDRATEWSGKRDKMEIFVKVISVNDGALLASAEIKGKSSWATFGGDHPQDLLKAPVQEYVDRLF